MVTMNRLPYDSPAMKELILGGARSGKSAMAEQRAAASGLDVVYIATAQPGDEEMARRIARHRRDRPGHWTVVEEPLYLAAVLSQHGSERRCVLVDCLTLWVSNLLHHPQASLLEQQREALLACLGDLPSTVIFVSNEVGMGVVPMGEVSRRFCDETGRLHQALARRCERVTLMVAGLPLTVKGEES